MRIAIEKEPNNVNHFSIPRDEFVDRIERLKAYMAENAIDAMLVYGDEYRKEQLRYVSNYWPMFERGALLIPMSSDPVCICAPEGEQVAREMSVWEDIRVVPDFLCVTVPDEIEYPLASYTSFKELADELREGGELRRLGVVGMDAMSEDLLHTIRSAFGSDVIDANGALHELRRIKSPREIACLREAARIAEAGIKELMESDLIGMTEREAAGIAEGVARREGAEAIVFTVFGSGTRSASIIGRPTEKVIEDGDMIMCAMAVQYEGYVATCEVPFAVGDYSSETKRVIDVLVHAAAAGLPHLKPGVPMQQFVSAVRDYFRSVGLSEYDIYPPLHGIGCAEAESPYPNEHTEEVFEPGMTVNTDISLFGLAGGSNRVEEGFVITQTGAESLSPWTRTYYENWIADRHG